MHTFTWAPAARQRHASLDPAPGAGYPTGMTVETLCGHQLATENTEYAWLWPTCPACDTKTRAMVGAPSLDECQVPPR